MSRISARLLFYLQNRAVCMEPSFPDNVRNFRKKVGITKTRELTKALSFKIRFSSLTSPVKWQNAGLKLAPRELLSSH